MPAPHSLSSSHWSQGGRPESLLPPPQGPGPPPHGRQAVSPCRGAGRAPSGPHGAVPSGSSRLLAGASPQCPRTLGAARRGLALGILDCGVQAALHLGRVHPALAGVGTGPSEADRDSLMEAGGRLKSRALGVGAGSVWLCGHGGHRTVSRSVTGKSLSPHRTTGLTWWPRRAHGRRGC